VPPAKTFATIEDIGNKLNLTSAIAQKLSSPTVFVLLAPVSFILTYSRRKMAKTSRRVEKGLMITTEATI
jgi:hypothetical protein